MKPRPNAGWLSSCTWPTQKIQNQMRNAMQNWPGPGSFSQRRMIELRGSDVVGGSGDDMAAALADLRASARTARDGAAGTLARCRR